MGEAAVNAYAQELVELTVNKSRYDNWDLQWYTESPFWRRTNMKFSRTYKQIPDYELGDRRHGLSLADIQDVAQVLLKDLKSYQQTSAPQEKERVRYLVENVGNLLFRTNMLLGEKYSYDEMTMGLYDVVCPESDYDTFDKARADMNAALGNFGGTDFVNKIAAFRNAIRIPESSLYDVIAGTTLWWHDSAVKNMHVTGNSMPRVHVRALANPNWVFLSVLMGYDYNHIEYERNFNSLYPWTVDKVIEYVGHEMEPGHLTCFEKRTQQFIDNCWPEMSVISQHSGANALGEGTARYASSILSFHNSMKEQIDFEKEYIFTPAGLDTGLLELMPLWHRYCEIADFGKLEASRHAWNGDWSEEELINFLEGYGFAGKGDGKAMIDTFATDDPGHYTAHYYSRELVKKYFAGQQADIPAQWALYEKLCGSHETLKSIKEKAEA